MKQIKIKYDLDCLSFSIYYYLQTYMLKREAATIENHLLLQFEDPSIDLKNKNKTASLAPYMAQIQRRKKIRTIGKRSKKNINESSSKSFRIKEKSVTSLQKEAYLKNKQITTVNFVNKLLEDRTNRERKAKSVQKTHQFQYSRTLDSRGLITQKTNNNFFNDLFVRVKQKLEKQKPAKKEFMKTIEDHRAKSVQAGEINVSKIGITNPMTHALKKECSQDIKMKQQPTKKINFRRNKYQAMISSAASNTIQNFKAQQSNRECIQSDCHVQLDKKQSNVSINKQMDRIAQRQVENYFNEVRNQQIHSSIEKSTEKYFKYQSYRPAKSKNDIQVCLSTIRDPLHKVSHSTNDRDETNQRIAAFDYTATNKINDLLNYDFDFKNQDNQEINKHPQIQEIDNASDQESSLHFDQSQNQFQEQRRKVEVEYFKKEEAHLDWSDDDCRIDEIL